MKNTLKNEMTEDDALEKIKVDILALKHTDHVRVLMDILKIRESVFRRCFLTPGEQIELLKTNTATWNSWHGFVFPGVLHVTEKIDALAPELVMGNTVYAGFPESASKRKRFNPFIINELAVRALIKLTSTDFTDCDLSPAHFRWGVNLSGCRFDSANLEGANFSGCVFDNVSFKNANLRHVVFEECVFLNADFSGADLSFARGTSYFRGDILLEGARIKANCLVLHCIETNLAPDAQNAEVKGRLIPENGSAKFLPDPNAEENVEEWREW